MDNETIYENLEQDIKELINTCKTNKDSIFGIFNKLSTKSAIFFICDISYCNFFNNLYNIKYFENSNRFNKAELELLYNNIEKMDNNFLQAFLYDFFCSIRFNESNYIKDVIKTKDLYYTCLNYMLDNNNNHKYFKIYLIRYITLLSFDKKNKKEGFSKLNDLINKIQEKKIYEFLIYFIQLKEQYLIEFLNFNNFQKNIEYFKNLIINYVLNMKDDIFIEKISNFNDLSKIINKLNSNSNFIYNNDLLKLLIFIYKNCIKSIRNYDNRLKFFCYEELLEFFNKYQNVDKIIIQRIIDKLLLKNNKIKEVFEFSEFETIYEPKDSDEIILKNFMIEYYEIINAYLLKRINLNEFINRIIKYNYNQILFLLDINLSVDNLKQKNNTLIDKINITHLEEDTNNIINGKNFEEQRLIETYLNYISLFNINILKFIKENNLITKEFLFNYFKDSEFIPQNQLLFFVDGFYYFFKNELRVAFSILIPKFENSLRYFLENKNINTTKIARSKEYSEEKNIKIIELLNKIEERNLLNEKDKRLYFFLKKIFDENCFNIRNTLCHGFDNDFKYYNRNIYNVFITMFLYIIKKPNINPTQNTH